MTDHHGLWALMRGTDVEGANRPIHARGGQDRRSIFIPVMCQSFGRRTGGRWDARFTRNRRYRGGMDRDLESEVVGCGSGCAKVEKTDVRVGGNTRKDVRRMWREGCGVSAAVCGKSDERMRTIGSPDAHSTVPAAGTETVFRDEIPVHTEDFTVVFFPILDGEVIQVAIEQLNATVPRGCENLIFVDLRPRKIVERVLGGKPGIIWLE